MQENVNFEIIIILCRADRCYYRNVKADNPPFMFDTVP